MTFADWSDAVQAAGGLVTAWPPDKNTGMANPRYAARYDVATFGALELSNNALVNVPNDSILLANSGEYVYVLAPGSTQTDANQQQQQATNALPNLNPSWLQQIEDELGTVGKWLVVGGAVVLGVTVLSRLPRR